MGEEKYIKKEEQGTHPAPPTSKQLDHYDHPEQH